ncbi:unnamed protein product [Closterium sp. NIES-53]
MASWRSTCTYVDAVPPPMANVVIGMWIFKTTSCTPSTSRLPFFRVASRGDMAPGFTSTFPPGIQWSLRRPVYGLRQVPREWHDTLCTTLGDLGFRPSSADPSLFVRRGSTPFFDIVSVYDMVFATADMVALVQRRGRDLCWCHGCLGASLVDILVTDLRERPRSAPTLFLDKKAMILLCQEPRLEGTQTSHMGVCQITQPVAPPLKARKPPLQPSRSPCGPRTAPAARSPPACGPPATLAARSPPFQPARRPLRPARRPLPPSCSLRAAPCSPLAALLRHARRPYSPLATRLRPARHPCSLLAAPCHPRAGLLQPARRPLQSARRPLRPARCPLQPAKALYDAVVARYSSPATAALGCLILPYLFPKLSAFATVEDLVTHLRTSVARYRAALPADFLDTNLPPMYITLYFIVTCLPDSLRAHLLAAETSVVAVGAARGPPRTPFFEGCSPSPLAPFYASAAAVDVLGAEDVGDASASGKRRRSKGKAGRIGGGGSGDGGGGGSGDGGGSGGGGSSGSSGGSGGFGAAVVAAVGVAVVATVGVVAVGLELFRGEVLEVARGSSSNIGARPLLPSSFTCGKPHSQQLCFSRLDDAWCPEFGDEAERPRWGELLRSRVDIFALDYDAILASMYALFVSAEGDCYLYVPPDPGIEAVGLGASESVLPGTAPAEALHTFTLDSVASHCFFRDSTTLTPLSPPVLVRLADPLGGPVLARSSTVLPCVRVRSGSTPVLVSPLGAGGAGIGGAASGGTSAGGTVQRCPFFVLPQPLSLLPPNSVLRQVLSLSSSTCLPPSLLSPPPLQSQQLLQPDSPLPAPSPYAEQTDSFTERREPVSRPASPVCTSPRVPLPRPPLVLGTYDMALLAELVDFAGACRLDYTTSLVAKFEFDCPPFVGGECALGTDVVEDRQEDFECLAAVVPHLVAMLLALEGDPEAPDIPTPRSYAEAITGPYSSQWQTAMDAEMASWKSTCTYVNAAPPSGANIVDGMWIFRVKRPPSSPLVFKARLRRPVYSLRQAPHKWHDTQRTTLAALGFAPSTADPSLFQCTATLLLPFYVLVYIDDLVFATADTEALALVKLELQKRHTCTDLAPPSDESVEPSGPYLELVGCLMYLMTCTRPDLAYPFSIMARYVAPGRHRPEQWEAAKRVLRYLCSTSGMGLVLGGRGPIVLTGHEDASSVDDLSTQRSSQGYTFSLGSGSVSWWSTRSSSVLSSCCEAEIYAGAMAAQELRWLTYLLTDLGEWPRSSPLLYVDNKAMIALCQEHRLEHRTKHIALRYFLARELQQRGQLRLAYVATRAKTANVFTKELPPGDHQRFATVLGLVPTLPHLLTA